VFTEQVCGVVQHRAVDYFKGWTVSIIGCTRALSAPSCLSRWPTPSWFEPVLHASQPSLSSITYAGRTRP